MVKKKHLLNNLRDYSADEIAQAVYNGEVTIYELSHNSAGAFSPLLRRRVEEILSSLQKGSDTHEEEEDASIDIYNTASDEETIVDASPAKSHVKMASGTSYIPTLTMSANTERDEETIDDASSEEKDKWEKKITYINKNPETMIESPNVTPVPQDYNDNQADDNNNYGNDDDEDFEEEDSETDKDSTVEVGQALFSAPFSFKGRIRRLEYGLSNIVGNIILSVMNSILFYLVNKAEQDSASGLDAAVFGIFYIITLIPVLWFLIAQTTKRCHDIGISGWWQILLDIPPLPIVLLLIPGNKGSNKYGNDPK